MKKRRQEVHIKIWGPTKKLSHRQIKTIRMKNYHKERWQRILSQDFNIIQKKKKKETRAKISNVKKIKKKNHKHKIKIKKNLILEPSPKINR